MSRPDKSKIGTDGGADLGQNPFASALGGLGGLMPAGPAASGGSGAASKPATEPEPAKSRGRVDVLRTTAGRGGKTVTVAKNFVGIDLPEKEAL